MQNESKKILKKYKNYVYNNNIPIEIDCIMKRKRWIYKSVYYVLCTSMNSMVKLYK